MHLRTHVCCLAPRLRTTQPRSRARRAAQVPLDTNAFVTAWLPLRSLTRADSALAFASGSHRDFSLPYWHNEAGLAAGLAARGYAVEAPAAPPLALGDATWHAGWTLHCAGPQPAGAPPRVALAASFFADGARRLSSRCAGARRAAQPRGYAPAAARIAAVAPARAAARARRASAARRGSTHPGR